MISPSTACAHSVVLRTSTAECQQRPFDEHASEQPLILPSASAASLPASLDKSGTCIRIFAICLFTFLASRQRMYSLTPPQNKETFPIWQCLRRQASSTQKERNSNHDGSFSKQRTNLK